ncbi:hypothetical protein [Fulvivirga lutimaris]|uniref:hypothetical protein n=1 Tax=Fulvivirga lutimaris TaxID=1819566 RepID=UPI0012BB6AD1|nr:hypothetical protein [Fulvivirga lutimaris]MTI39979.1 hypothetical protein [Fulvivirga lutimaris]
MTSEEIEALLHQAIDKIKLLETKCDKRVEELEARVVYLEEVISSQKHMLADSVKYIQKIEKLSLKKGGQK